MAERTDKRTRMLIALALVVVGLGLGLYVSRPLPAHLTRAVPYTMSAKPGERVVDVVHGDHLQYIYHLGQLRLAAEGRAPWLRNTYEFAGPYGFTEFYVYFPTALVYWPLSYVSEAFAFNAIVLLSFVGTMIAGYGLARAWGANRGGAFCAGIVLTLFPARLDSLFGGHPAGSAFFLFPMAWWGLEKIWATGRRSWGWLAAVCLVLLARLEPHHLFYLCMLLPFWAFWKLAEAGTFAKRHTDNTAVSSSRTRHIIDALPAIAAALIAAGCVHYNQIRFRVIDGFGWEIASLAVFFLLGVFVVRWLVARAVDWLGVSDESFRRLWLTVPWFAFWLLAFYFLAGLTDKEAFGLRLVRACVGLFIVAQIVFLIVAATKKLLRPGAIKLPWRRIATLWPVFIGLAIAVAYELYLKMAVFDVSGVQGGRTLHEVRLFSEPFGDLFDNRSGNGAYVGWIPWFIVVLLAFFWRPGGADIQAPRTSLRHLRVATVLFCLGVILMCGPLISSCFPLYEALFRLVPPFRFTRATDKYAILAATFGAVASAIALSLWFAGPPGRRRLARSILAHAAFIVAFFTLYTRVVSVGVSRLPAENTAYAYVTEHSQGAPLVEIPIWPGNSAWSGIYQYWTLRTHVPTVNGYSPTVPRGYIEHVSWPLYDLNYGRFGPREAAVTDELGVRFINFHEEAFPRQVSEFPATTSLKMLRLNPNLKLVAEDGPIHLFEILGQPPRELDPSALPFLSRYVPAVELKRHVGRIVNDPGALDGRAIESDGRQGQLFFGPFAVLPTGDYIAVFRIKAHAQDADDEIGALDIYVKRDKIPPPKEPLVVRTLTGADWQDADGYRLVEIAFTLEGTQEVETRGWFNGAKGTSLALDYVFIQSATTGNAIRLEAEEFFHAPARLVEDDEASEDLSLEFDDASKSGQTVLDERFVLLAYPIDRITCRATGTGDTIAEVVVRSIRDKKGVFVMPVAPGDNDYRFEDSTDGFSNRPGIYAISVRATSRTLQAIDYIEIVEVRPVHSPEE